MNGRVARGSLNGRWRPQDDRRPNVQGVLTLEHFLPAGTRVHVAGRSRMAAGVEFVSSAATVPTKAVPGRERPAAIGRGPSRARKVF